MRQQTIGNILIDKITEIPLFPMEAGFLMPGITPEIVASGRTWLPPGFIDPVLDRVALSFHSYVIRTKHHRILVDTCVGNHKDRVSMPGWHELNTPYLQELAAIGLRPDDIDIVLCTHLHADHVGWNTQLLDGRWVPTFPNARYIMGRTEFAHWQALHDATPTAPVNRGAFADSVLPIVEAGRAVMVESDHIIEGELSDGVWLKPSPGHSPGHFCVHVCNGAAHAVLSGDAIHHPLQLSHPHLPIAADFDRIAAQASRRDLLESCADTASLLLTAHFPEPTGGHVIRHADAYRFRF